MKTAPPSGILALLGLVLAPAAADGQRMAAGGDRARSHAPGARAAWVQVESREVREAAERASGLHLLVSRSERRLWLRDGSIVLHEASAAVGKGGTLEHEGQLWSFSTPVGERRVLGKAEDPVWVPPDWHYVETAREHGLHLVPLPGRGGIPLADGTRVVVRGERVGRLWPDGRWEAVPPGEEVIYGDTLLVPPLGTANRRVAGELGRYKLDLGDGYLIHGTRDPASVGSAATHGCLRLHEADLRLLYDRVPVGTPVFIY